jgi:hypothetical protein
LGRLLESRIVQNNKAPEGALFSPRTQTTTHANWRAIFCCSLSSTAGVRVP